MKILRIGIAIWALFMIMHFYGYKKVQKSDYMMPEDATPTIKHFLPDSIRFHGNHIKEYHEKEVTVNPN